jgi:hypothetical protein
MYWYMKRFILQRRQNLLRVVRVARARFLKRRSTFVKVLGAKSAVSL